VTGPGTLTFDYKLSCDAGDEYAFSIDGQYRSGRAGSKDWTTSGPWTITGAGTHTIRWKFIKDSSGSSGSDCLWIDRIRWTGAMPDGEGWDRIEYAYDAAGRRIEKKVDGTTQVKYVYDGSHILAEYNSAGTLLRKYVHGLGIDEPICMIEASGTYAGTHYYHYDALGSVVTMTNSAGNVTQLYEYSVYGQVAASDADHPNRFMFTGREFDKDTGLYYYRARYYHPEIGRFLQTDPIGYGDGMNWYGYCLNGPVGGRDPSGMSMDYTVAKFHDSDASNGIETVFGGDPNSSFRASSWEFWVGEMVRMSSAGIIPLGPEDVGWTLAQGDLATFWTIRAIIHLGIFKESEVSALEKHGVRVTDFKGMGVNVVHYRRNPPPGHTGTDLHFVPDDVNGDKIFWSSTTLKSSEAEREKYTWIHSLSPISALAHEMTHALLHVQGKKNNEKDPTTRQNRTLVEMYNWCPAHWEATFAMIRLAEPKFDPIKPGGNKIRVPW
jgi:RHS repeat-associated protein